MLTVRLIARMLSLSFLHAPESSYNCANVVTTSPLI